jgi:hypothetical protein
MLKKVLTWILIIIGGVGLVLSLIADLIGIGSYPGFNYAQIIGSLLGLAIFIYGIWFLRRKEEKKEKKEEKE